MNNFEYYNPTNSVFGKNQTQIVAKLIPANAKILLAKVAFFWKL